MDDVPYELPPDASPEMTAIAALHEGLHSLHLTMTALNDQHATLTARVEQVAKRSKRKAPTDMPWPLRWNELDRDAAQEAWAWLIDWVAWFVPRYQLVEEIPPCWPRHGAFLEELTALAAGWQAATDENADPGGLLVWHERLARARLRWRDWDESTRCRNGTHTVRQLDLDWPPNWRINAYQIADADIASRRATATQTGNTAQRGAQR
ncbi:hypothetical protein [Actinoplanes sp. NPDC051859]|uniref:hypothetical protein n=1 Tax=Actinoplanes sp. NPDC051859 TaxID=3363909 RepID=UPI0037A49287